QPKVLSTLYEEMSLAVIETTRLCRIDLIFFLSHCGHSPISNVPIFSARFFGPTLQSPRQVLSKKSLQCSKNMNQRSNSKEPSCRESVGVPILTLLRRLKRGFRVFL